jgi:hypothetical protein
VIAVMAALGLVLLGGVAGARGGHPRRGSGYEFAPYVDMTLSPPPDLMKLHDASGTTEVSLGFVTAQGGRACTPTWGGYAADPASGPRAFRRANVAAFWREGGIPVPSFGGQAGTELASACASERALERAYDGVVEAYRPVRVDFDIEGAAVADTSAIARRSEAIAALQDAHASTGLQVSFTLPVLPTGLDSDALGVLRSAIKHHVKITYVNLMTMDYGNSAAPDPAGKMGSYAIQAARAASRQLRRLYPHLSAKRRMRMIGMTPMIGINDTSDEVFTLSDAAQLARFAHSRHVGMLAMWELSRDHQCPHQVTQTQLRCSGVAQSDFAFAKTLGP